MFDLMALCLTALVFFILGLSVHGLWHRCPIAPREPEPFVDWEGVLKEVQKK